MNGMFLRYKNTHSQWLSIFDVLLLFYNFIVHSHASASENTRLNVNVLLLLLSTIYKAPTVITLGIMDVFGINHSIIRVIRFNIPLIQAEVLIDFFIGECFTSYRQYFSQVT